MAAYADVHRLPHCPRRRFKQICDSGGVRKAKLQTALASLPRFVLLIYFIRITKLCLTIAPGGSNKGRKWGGLWWLLTVVPSSSLLLSLMRKHRRRAGCVRAARVTHV